MRQYIRQAAVTAGAILFAGLVQPLLPNTITEIRPLALLNNSAVQFVLIAVIALYVFSNAFSWLRSKLRKSPGHFFEVISPRREPTRVDQRLTAEKFGVVWPILYGRRTITGERYAYAKNPRCPECDTELMEDENRRRIRSDMFLWRCPGCGFTRKRPQTWLYEEKEAVEKDVEARIRNQ